jgi:hypothetical protein
MLLVLLRSMRYHKTATVARYELQLMPGGNATHRGRFNGSARALRVTVAASFVESVDSGNELMQYFPDPPRSCSEHTADIAVHNANQLLCTILLAAEGFCLPAALSSQLQACNPPCSSCQGQHRPRSQLQVAAATACRRAQAGSD